MIDVAIVGGGPVGLFLATLLLQQGVSVTVLERRTAGTGGHSRAIGIHPPALGALSRAGVDQELIRRGVKIRRGVAVNGGRTLAGMSFDAVPGPYPFVLSLPQNTTEEVLAARLRGLDPGALRCGVRVTGLAGVGREGDPVRVRTDSSGHVAEFEASLVVGADGIRSVVRSAVGLGTHGRDYPDRYLMGDFDDGTGLGPDAALFLASGGIVESFPLPGRQRRWVVRLNGRTTPDDGAHGLAGEVRRRTGVSVDAGSNTMMSIFGVRSRVVRRMAVGRCVLIGDAAHEISPIGGQGMNLGWLDAVELAGLIPSILSTGRSHDVSVMPGLRAFEHRRLRAAARAVRQSEINMALGRPLPAGVLAARNGAIAAAASVPALNRWTARRFTMH